MIIYIDEQYRCHSEDDGTMTAIETDFFNGKCSAFIEGYVFLPEGKTIEYDSKLTMKGEAIFPWEDIRVLNAYQTQYEAMTAGGTEE